ncbi:Calreticulin family-domain-containing protein [Entophlyctis helioformis]|nr:Calreticulin family-domain-containing protein [Entophlyctis helioformis]
MKIFSVLALATTVQLAAAKVYFKETFASDKVPERWVVSEKRTDYGQWAVSAGKFHADAESSRGLQTSEDARFYAISAPLDEEFDNKDKPLVLQFSAKFEQNIDCGGGYIKLIPKPFEPKAFEGSTKYNIMFGPDICGMDKKTHVIFNYKDENYLISKTINPGSDQLTHVYTLVLNPDQTYQVLIDLEEKAKGSLLEDWNFLPPAKIPDPKAKKPEDWVDEAEIDDPTDVKPDGWDNAPEMMTDLDATKPDDWDEEMDGEWEAPKIPNPDYKGEWKAKRIPNPKYKGEWVHPQIDNPEYALDKTIYHYKSAFVGFDLWQVKSGTIFDNIIVTDSLEEAEAFAKETFVAEKAAEQAAKDKLDAEEAAKLSADAKDAGEAKEPEAADDAEPVLEEAAGDEEEGHGEL